MNKVLETLLLIVDGRDTEINTWQETKNMYCECEFEEPQSKEIVKGIVVWPFTFKAKDIWEICLQNNPKGRKQNKWFRLQEVYKHEKGYLDLKKSLIDNGWKPPGSNLINNMISLRILINKNDDPSILVENGNHRLSIMYLNNLNYDVETKLTVYHSASVNLTRMMYIIKKGTIINEKRIS